MASEGRIGNGRIVGGTSREPVCRAQGDKEEPVKETEQEQWVG